MSRRSEYTGPDPVMKAAPVLRPVMVLEHRGPSRRTRRSSGFQLPWRWKASWFMRNEPASGPTSAYPQRGPSKRAALKAARRRSAAAATAPSAGGGSVEVSHERVNEPGAGGSDLVAAAIVIVVVVLGLGRLLWALVEVAAR